MKTSSLLVVGASLAGLRAVESARRIGYAGPIMLIGDELHLPYDRPPLSKAVLDIGGHSAEATFRTRRHLIEDLGIDLRLGVHAEGLDVENRLLETSEGAIPFSGLVLATGSSPKRLPALDETNGVHVLRTLDDARRLREALDAGARVAVIGGGFIGAEVASAARRRGLDTTIIEATQTPLARAVGEEMGHRLARLHDANEVALRCGVSVTGALGEGRLEGLTLSDGSTVLADAVVVGVGSVPNTRWLEGSALELGDGIVCSATLETSVSGVYAAGDVARFPNATFHREMRLEHWTSAAEQGSVAGGNAVDPAGARTFETVPYFWSDWYGVRIQFVGIPSADEVLITHAESIDKFVALYRSGDQCVGALTVNNPGRTMKYRRLIASSDRHSWRDAVGL